MAGLSCSGATNSNHSQSISLFLHPSLRSPFSLRVAQADLEFLILLLALNLSKRTRLVTRVTGKTTQLTSQPGSQHLSPSMNRDRKLF